tara:strand:- start:134 stop:925 length:792 start_codon:yes stop_codon:yes gene_type:complete
MTTEKNEVTANEEQNVTANEDAQQIVDKISEDAVQKVQDRVEEKIQEQQPKEQEDVAKIVRETVTQEMNNFRGNFVNWTAQQQRELRQTLDDSLKGYKQHQEALEQQNLSQMDPEEQVAYWKQKATQPVEPQIEEQQSERNFSQVYNAATGAAMALGINIDVKNDQRIWEGANAGMTDQQLLQLANQNLAKLKQTSNTAQPQKTQVVNESPPPPPSTEGAPKAGNARFTTLSDLASQMASGNINADQYRKGQREIKNQGYTTL